jgi:hypothetical protein
VDECGVLCKKSVVLWSFLASLQEVPSGFVADYALALACCFGLGHMTFGDLHRICTAM